MRKGIIVGGVLVVALAAVVAAPKLLREKAAVEEAPIPTVEVQKMEPATIILRRNLVGTVEPSDVVYIYPKAAGEVTDVYIKAGDVVAEGQAVCKIDTKQVEAARLSMEAAKTALDNANSTLARQQALFAAGDIASATLEQVQTQARSAKIQYDQAKLNYNYQVEFSNITAPMGGVVEQCNVEVHDNVAQQSLVCVISGEGSKQLTFSVTEKVVNHLQVGEDVAIDKNGTKYQGTITEISSMIDQATGLFKIKASVENGDALPTGSMVSLSVVSEKQEGVLSLPVDSVYYSGGNAYVYTCVEGEVHQVPVEIGIYDSQRVQILSGLEAEDQVITTWSSELFEGSKVNPVAPGQSGNGDPAAVADSEAQTGGGKAE